MTKHHKIILFALITGAVLIFMNSCKDDDLNENEEVAQILIENGLELPKGNNWGGDSLLITKSLSIQSTSGKSQVIVESTESGKISVLGGYKESAIYVYAKPIGLLGLFDKEKVRSIFDKYYIIEIDNSSSEIRVNISEKDGIEHGNDFRNLLIYVEIYTPSRVSTNLSVKNGDIYIRNLNGYEHKGRSVNGAIRYERVLGEKFDVESRSGYLSFTNVIGTQSMDVVLDNGSIDFALPRNSSATLNLSSLTNVKASILNNKNFNGNRSGTKINGELNGGGCKINAINKLGSIQLNWYYGI